MKDIFKIVESLKELDLLIKCITQTIEYETKEQRREFFGMLLGTVHTIFLRNMLVGNGVIRAGKDCQCYLIL